MNTDCADVQDVDFTEALQTAPIGENGVRRVASYESHEQLRLGHNELASGYREMCALVADIARVVASEKRLSEQRDASLALSVVILLGALAFFALGG